VQPPECWRTFTDVYDASVRHLPSAAGSKTERVSASPAQLLVWKPCNFEYEVRLVMPTAAALVVLTAARTRAARVEKYILTKLEMSSNVCRVVWLRGVW
jgi:hypothetical protein